MTRFLTLKVVGTVSLTVVSGSLLTFSYGTIPSLLTLLGTKSTTPPTSGGRATESNIAPAEDPNESFRSKLQSSWDRLKWIIYPASLLSFSCFTLSFALSDKYNRHPYLLYSAFATPVLLIANYIKISPLIRSIINLASAISPTNDYYMPTSTSLASPGPSQSNNHNPSVPSVTSQSQADPSILSTSSSTSTLTSTSSSSASLKAETEANAFKSSLDDSIYQDLGDETFTDDDIFSPMEQVSPMVSSGLATDVPTPLPLDNNHNQDNKTIIKDHYSNQMSKLKQSLNIYLVGIHTFINVLALVGILGDS